MPVYFVYVYGCEDPSLRIFSKYYNITKQIIVVLALADWYLRNSSIYEQNVLEPNALVSAMNPRNLTFDIVTLTFDWI